MYRATVIALVTLTLGLFGCSTPIPIPADLCSARIGDLILLQTPESIHYESGATFSWVLFDRDQCVGFTIAELDAVESALRTKYGRLYLRESDIPIENIHFGSEWPTRTPSGYRGGFRIQYSLTRPTAKSVALQSSDWEGPRAAASGSRLYTWDGKTWKCIDEGQFVVA